MKQRKGFVFESAHIRYLRKRIAVVRRLRVCARPRSAPEGYRTVAHFLSCVREVVGARYGATLALARYLDVHEASVRRWIKGQKMPMQPTIDAMGRWMVQERAKKQ